MNTHYTMFQSISEQFVSRQGRIQGVASEASATLGKKPAVFHVKNI